MSVETFASKWVSVKHKILKSEKLSSIKSSLFLILLIFKCKIERSCTFSGPGLVSISPA